MKINKIFTLISIVALALAVIIYAAIWQSPGVNFGAARKIHQCIYDDNKKLHFHLNGAEKNYFDISLVKNTGADCINPYFPTIHIKASDTHNAWVQIVYTDSNIPQLQVFIDAENTTYPFYTYAQDFYDAPIWRYNLLDKPLSFWRANAFAAKIDAENKTVSCVCGVEWGFELSFFKLRPKAIYPKLLGKKDWDAAWEILKEKLPGYQQKYDIN